MDPNTFSGFLDSLAFDVGIISNDGVAWVSNFGAVLDGIESPVVSSMGTSYFLLDRGEETLGVEESGQPERDGSVFLEPVIKSEVTVLERTQPLGECGTEPRHFGTRGINQPHGGYTEIKNEFDAIG